MVDLQVRHMWAAHTRTSGMTWRFLSDLGVCLLSLVIAGCGAVTVPDRGQYVQAKTRDAEIIVLANNRTYYFENRFPHCLAYSLTGYWEFAIQVAALRTPDRRHFVGVLLHDDADIPGQPGDDLMARVMAWIHIETQKDWEIQIPAPSTVESLETSRGRAAILQFGDVAVTSKTAKRMLTDTPPKVGTIVSLPKKVIVPIWQGSVLVITTSDIADAREVLETLEITEHPRCWEPTIRERFPGVLQ